MWNFFWTCHHDMLLKENIIKHTVSLSLHQKISIILRNFVITCQVRLHFYSISRSNVMKWDPSCNYIWCIINMMNEHNQLFPKMKAEANLKQSGKTTLRILFFQLFFFHHGHDNSMTSKARFWVSQICKPAVAQESKIILDVEINHKWRLT